MDSKKKKNPISRRRDKTNYARATGNKCKTGVHLIFFFFYLETFSTLRLLKQVNHASQIEIYALNCKNVADMSLKYSYTLRPMTTRLSWYNIWVPR